jgi:protein TonB
MPTLALADYALTEVDPSVRKRRGVAVPVSVGLHAVAAAALAIVPLLMSDALPETGGDIRAFFVEPLAAPPPPPPPPPPAARASLAARVAPKAAAVPVGFVAPIEVPTEIRPEEGLDLGGIEGAPPVKAVRVGGDIHEPRKVLDVAPVYPDVAMKAGVQGIVIIEATVDARGRVANATVLRGLPVLDEAALEAVRKWVYTPTLLNGVPTPIILTVTVSFRFKNTR